MTPRGRGTRRIDGSASNLQRYSDSPSKGGSGGEEQCDVTFCSAAEQKPGSRRPRVNRLMDSKRCVEIGTTDDDV